MCAIRDIFFDDLIRVVVPPGIIEISLVDQKIGADFRNWNYNLSRGRKEVYIVVGIPELSKRGIQTDTLGSFEGCIPDDDPVNEGTSIPGDFGSGGKQQVPVAIIDVVVVELLMKNPPLFFISLICFGGYMA